MGAIPKFLTSYGWPTTTKILWAPLLYGTPIPCMSIPCDRTCHHFVSFVAPDICTGIILAENVAMPHPPDIPHVDRRPPMAYNETFHNPGDARRITSFLPFALSCGLHIGGTNGGQVSKLAPCSPGVRPTPAAEKIIRGATHHMQGMPPGLSGSHFSAHCPPQAVTSLVLTVLAWPSFPTLDVSAATLTLKRLALRESPSLLASNMPSAFFRIRVQRTLILHNVCVPRPLCGAVIPATMPLVTLSGLSLHQGMLEVKESFSTARIPFFRAESPSLRSATRLFCLATSLSLPLGGFSDATLPCFIILCSLHTYNA